MIVRQIIDLLHTEQYTSRCPSGTIVSSSLRVTDTCRVFTIIPPPGPAPKRKSPAREKKTKGGIIKQK